MKITDFTEKLNNALSKEDIKIDFEVLENQSTNEYATKNLKKDKMLYVAIQQHNGQGRKQRTFESYKGGAYFTLQLKVVKSSFLPNIYVISAGLATVLALKEFNINASLKWPNDVMTNGKKVAGILCKCVFENEYTWVNVGIGINVENDISSINDIATKLTDYNNNISLFNVIACVVKNLLILLNKDFNDILMEYKKYCSTLNKNVRIITEKDDYLAYVKDVSTDGELIIEREGKKEVIINGDVTIR